jgi:hypothetical protein
MERVAAAPPSAVGPGNGRRPRLQHVTSFFAGPHHFFLASLYHVVSLAFITPTSYHGTSMLAAVCRRDRLLLSPDNTA